MSRLRFADYTEALKGRTVRRVLWTNEPDFHELIFDFEDDYQVAFRFVVGIEEDVELKNGDSFHPLSAMPRPMKGPHEK
jgi:hypothetical protein